MKYFKSRIGKMVIDNDRVFTFKSEAVQTDDKNFIANLDGALGVESITKKQYDKLTGQDNPAEDTDPVSEEPENEES